MNEIFKHAYEFQANAMITVSFEVTPGTRDALDVNNFFTHETATGIKNEGVTKSDRNEYFH
jgi:hypothetical protein